MLYSSESGSDTWFFFLMLPNCFDTHNLPCLSVIEFMNESVKWEAHFLQTKTLSGMAPIIKT